MNRGSISVEFVGRQDGKTYRAQLDVQLKPLFVDGEAAAVGDTLQSEQLAPGQTIPDGDYTRRPHGFDPKESRVRIAGGRMYAGWR
jgi:hypothetical protein